jgi:peptidoglycan/xylan/chitin deacetylase (PgdA/CDA1 family)
MARAFCAAAYHSGALGLGARIAEPLDRRRADGRFQIFVYHRVAVDADPFVPATPVRVFEPQIQYLRKHFRILPLTDLLRAVQERDVPARAIAVTFDDGYEDTYRYMFPIARRYEIPITVFLTTGLIDVDQPMWNDLVGAALRDTNRTELSGVCDGQCLHLTSPAARLEALLTTLRFLKKHSLCRREELVAQIVRTLGAPPYRGPKLLRWQQIEEMHAHGVEFGAHTVHHPILTRIPFDARWREIADSKRAIEERLQTPVRHFAYPNGMSSDFDDSTKAQVKEAGFASAGTMICGTNTLDTDPYELCRIEPWEEVLPVFATKLWFYRQAHTRGSTSALTAPWQRGDGEHVR